MINEIKIAFNHTLQMFEDGIRNIPDEYWRQGSSDFLIPVRIAYHIMIVFLSIETGFWRQM